MAKSRICWNALLIGLIGSGMVVAQDVESAARERFLRQQRIIDEEIERQRLDEAPLDALLDVQWGGWIDYFIFHYDDGIQEQRVVQRPSLSVWARIRADRGAHEIFVRNRLYFTYFNPGDEIDRQQDWWGPNFDQAYYNVNVGRALRITEPDDPVQLGFRIGRQTTIFGTGYALDMPMDAVLMDLQLADFRVQGLFGKSIGSYPNIDRSEPVDSHSNRLFYGVQVAYEGWQHHRPFIYALWNNDRTDERPKDPFQNYAYDTFYFGAGADGQIVPNLFYWAEGVFESGRSYGDGDFLSRDYVEAWAWDIGIEKVFDVPMRPRVAGEYMFASGDPDRLFSPTNAAGGNRGDDKDSSFNGFGFRDTGLALSPINSNLHIWRLGGSFKPLEKVRGFREFEFGTNWFLYHKHHSRGAISDPLADEFDGYVGWEMDYYINWRIASDLSWTARWGLFFPGSAYSEDSSRHFFFTGLTWSF